MFKKKWDSLYQSFTKEIEQKNTGKAETILGQMKAYITDKSSAQEKTEYGFAKALMAQSQEDWENAERQLQKAILTAKDAKFIDEVFQGFKMLDQLMVQTQNTEKRHSYLEKAIKAATAWQQFKRRDTLMVTLANSFFTTGQFEKAESQFRKILDIGEDENNDYMHMKGLSGLSRTYLQKGAISKAKECNKQALFYAEKTKDSKDEFRLKLNLAGIHAYEYNYEESLKDYKSLLSDIRKLGYKREEIVATLNMGILNNYLGHYNDSRYYIDQAETFFRQYKDKSLGVSIMQAKARYFIDTGSVREGMELLSKALYISQKHHFTFHEVDILLDRAYLNCFLERWNKGGLDLVQAYEVGGALNYYALEIRGSVGKGCLSLIQGLDEQGMQVISNTMARTNNPKNLIALAPAAELVGFTFHYLDKKDKAMEFYNYALDFYKATHISRGVYRCEQYLKNQSPSI